MGFVILLFQIGNKRYGDQSQGYFFMPGEEGCGTFCDLLKIIASLGLICPVNMSLMAALNPSPGQMVLPLRKMGVNARRRGEASPFYLRLSI